MANAVFIDQAKVKAYINDPNGPVVRRMVIIGESVKQRTQAKLKAGFPRDFLAPSIVTRITTSSGRPGVQIGSNRVRTQPHPIEGNPVLVFHWPKAGGVVFFRHVNHPGSDLGTYLGSKLLEALLQTRGTV